MTHFDEGRRSLRQVVPVGVELDVGGEYQLFLLALYSWDDRFDVIYARNDPSSGPGGRKRIRHEDWDEEWTVRDDLGREYAPRRGGGGGGSLQLLRLALAPPIGDDVRSLTLTFFDKGEPRATHMVELPRREGECDS